MKIKPQICRFRGYRAYSRGFNGFLTFDSLAHRFFFWKLWYFGDLSHSRRLRFFIIWLSSLFKSLILKIYFWSFKFSFSLKMQAHSLSWRSLSWSICLPLTLMCIVAFQSWIARHLLALQRVEMNDLNSLIEIMSDLQVNQSLIVLILKHYETCASSFKLATTGRGGVASKPFTSSICGWSFGSKPSKSAASSAKKDLNFYFCGRWRLSHLGSH